MIRNDRVLHGFTLIELMVVIAIVSILAAFALPYYARYTNRAKFGDVIVATAPYKTAVHLCVQDLNMLNGCSADANGIRAGIATPLGYVQSLTAIDGVITATAIPELGGSTYILTPDHDASTNVVTWIVTGTCLSAGFCRD